MHIIFLAFLLAIFSANASVYAANKNRNFDTTIQTILKNHYNKYKDVEYFSGAALSVYLPNKPIKNYYIGTVSHEENSKKVSSRTLFQIGSITKSFTAAIILQLENEKKLNIDNTVAQWLPQYEKWSAITIKQMLNMTSGLPNYTDTPQLSLEEYYDLKRLWNDKSLVKLVYPEKFSPPLKSGYFYTNTNYILSSLIIEKITHHSFKKELINRTFKKANLENTFYTVPYLEPAVQSRLAHGYNYNQYDNPKLVGKDLHDNNLSWAGAAGAIISNTEDIIKWVKALFLNNTILTETQKNEMMSIVSLANGEPISKTNIKDALGFGLGIAQKFDDEIGRFWFYEGQTLGYRAIYIYVPSTGIIISCAFNSATNVENDHFSDLIKEVYKQTQLSQTDVPRSSARSKKTKSHLRDRSVKPSEDS